MTSDGPAATGSGSWAVPRHSDSHRQLLDRNLAGVYRVAWDGTILECNDAYASFFGPFVAADMIGMQVQPFYTDATTRERILADLERDSSFTAREICYRRADGAHVWALATAMRVPVEDGPAEIQGTLIDITGWRRAADALIESDGRFRALVSTAGTPIICTDREQRITTFNPAAEAIFGVPSAEAAGRPYAGLFPPGVRDKVASDLRRIAEGTAVAGFENVVRRADGQQTVILWNLRALLDADGQPTGVVAVGQDITARQRAEESLARQAHYLRALTETDRAILALQRPDAIAAAVLGRIGALLRCRGAAVVIFPDEAEDARVLAACGDSGWSDADALVVSRADLGCVPRIVPSARSGGRLLRVPLVIQGTPAGFLQVHQDDQTAAHGATDVEIARQIADRLAVALHNWQLFDTARDARLRLEAVSRRLVDVQEAERRRLGRELHDEIGQSLTALTLQLQSAAAGHGSGVEQTLELVRELIGQVRDLSLELRPAILDDLGLRPALLWHVERYQSLTGVRIRFHQEGLDGRFPHRLETAVYRIVQEALTNVARHARARDVRVGVTADAARIQVEVEDSGVGFDPAAVRADQSMGLSGMRERAMLLGGTLSIRTSPASGTLVRATIPRLHHEADGDQAPIGL